MLAIACSHNAAPRAALVGIDAATSVQAADAGVTDDAGLMCGLMPGAEDVDYWIGHYVEICNGWDEDCDGLVDEDFDKDGDRYSLCETANDLPLDCDDSNPLIHVNHAELCDGLDNDCDDEWDEGNDGGCPAAICSTSGSCPESLVCIAPGMACAEPAECPVMVLTGGYCDAPADLWSPTPCDPSTCIRWQNGTCWGDCRCAADGMYRWQVGCTE